LPIVERKRNPCIRTFQSPIQELLMEMQHTGAR